MSRTLRAQAAALDIPLRNIIECQATSGVLFSQPNQEVPPNCIMNSLVTGARINYGGHHGTIRYIGEVINSSGTWLGIEWDDPQRGKHDGSKDGLRYFHCQ